MNCHYHPDRDAKVHCSGCREPLCDQCATSQKDGVHKCSRCIALDAANEATASFDQRLEEKARKKEGKEVLKEKRKKLKTLFRYGILLVCIIIIVFQLPTLFSSFGDEKPLRHGTHDTDTQTDQCINILWDIAKELQRGNLPGDDLLCPKSKAPFVIEETGGDIIVRAPKPELYGLKDLRVSKKSPVPEVIK